MPRSGLLLVLAAAGAAVSSSGAIAAEQKRIETMLVVGDRITTSAATGLNLSLRETPQSVTIIDQQQMQDFGLDSVNDALSMATGVNVEKVETDRTYYNARGFDITNFQLDGIGLPLIWGIQFGDLDTAIFERVEIVRGANAMMTGAGNPSATINYVRKRPTKDFRAQGKLSYGSFDKKRVDGDVSGALNESGTVTGRLVYAHEERNSHLDYNSVNRDVLYAIGTWEATPQLKVTAGFTYHDNRADGVLWGALPLTFDDGTRINYPRSASTSADWTYWNVKEQSAFVELAYAFDNGWEAKLIGSYKQFKEHAKLLYAFGYPEKTTGLGVAGMTGIYPSKYNDYMIDAYANGPFEMFGRTHQLVLGATASMHKGKEYEDFFGGFPAYPSVYDWGRQEVEEPIYPGEYLAADQIDRLYRTYMAAHLDVTDELKVIVGFNWLKLRSTGFSYGIPTPRDASKVSPYAGLVFDLTDNVSVYASYTDIFNPQSEEDATGRALDPAHGKAYEAGFKTEWFDRKLYATAAVFSTQQNGLAEFAGVNPANGKSIYEGVDTKVKGYEFEVAGRIMDNWQIGGGWTQLWFDGPGGGTVKTYIPSQTLKLQTTYTIPDCNNLKLGAALRWQDDIYIMDLAKVTQKAYAVLDLSASIDVTENVRARLVAKNVTDKKYLTSLMWNQSYYAAPRTVLASLEYNF